MLAQPPCSTQDLYVIVDPIAWLLIIMRCFVKDPSNFLFVYACRLIFLIGYVSMTNLLISQTDTLEQLE